MSVAHIGVLPNDVLDALSVGSNNLAGIDSGDDVQSWRGGKSALCFLRLPHPRTGVPSLFLSYDSTAPSPGELGKTGIVEVQAVAPVNARSWFLGEQEAVADGKLLVLTPIDPTFLLIPLLQAAHPADGTLGSFRPADDVLEEAITLLVKAAFRNKDPSMSISEQDLHDFASLQCVRSALQRLCDIKAITPEIVVYRYSLPKLLEYLRVKVARLATTAMMEQSRTLIRSLAKDGLMEDGKEDLLEWGRIKAACDVISQYIPPSVYSALLASYDFTKLDVYLRTLHEETATLAVSHSNSSKSKEKEKDAGDKKRKNSSKTPQGVDKLKKANINGMAKMSSFFKKA